MIPHLASGMPAARPAAAQKVSPPAVAGGLASKHSGAAAKRHPAMSCDFKEAGETAGAAGLTQAPQAAHLDLADTLTRQAEGLGHLLERARLAVTQPETHLDHLAVTHRQATE